MPGRQERVTAYNRSAMKPLPSPRLGGKSNDALFAMTSPPVRRVLFDDKPKVSMKGDNFTEPLWREGPETEEERQARLLEEQEEAALKAGAKADIFEEVSEEEPEEGDDLDAVNDLPLHRACEDGDTQRARKCLDDGANVVETDENGCCGAGPRRLHAVTLTTWGRSGPSCEPRGHAADNSVLQRPRRCS